METKSAKQIINELADDIKVKDACRRIGGKDWKDLYQELFVIICEQPEEKIEQIYENNYLQFWIVRTLMNSVTANGRFYKKYHIINVEGEKDIRQEGEDEWEQKFIRQREIVGDILREIEQSGRQKAGWYKVNLLRLYAQVQNYSEISRLTGIPVITVSNDIIKFRRELATIIDKRS